MRVSLLLFLLCLPLVAQEKRLSRADIERGYFNLTIPSNGTSTETIFVGKGCVPLFLVTPSAWTTADLEVHGSYAESITPVPVYDGATQIIITNISASRFIKLEADIMFGLRAFKLVSTNPQAASRTLTVVCR